MAEVVQIDLVVNTAQLDVAEARYDALKARQLGLQGGTVAPGLSTPGAVIGGAIVAQMLGASTTQQIVYHQTQQKLLSAEAASVLGFTEKFAGRLGSASAEFGMMDGGYLKATVTDINAKLPNATGLSRGVSVVTGMSPFNEGDQNTYGTDYLRRQYFAKTGRYPSNSLSAKEIFAQTVAFSEQVRIADQVVEKARASQSTGSTPSAGVAGPGKTAKAMWSKAKAGILKVPGKTVSGSAAVLAFAVLDGMVDDTLQDADFRVAAGIKADDVTYMGGTAKQSVSSTLYDAHVMTYGRASRAFAMHPLAFMFSKSTMSERMQAIEKYNKSGGVVGWAATKIGLKSYSQDAVLKATETIARTKRELVGQNEWGQIFNKGMQDIEARATRSSQDFMQRVYGGGDVDRWAAAEWVKPAVVRLQKEKFANEAWTKHPNARIAVDPPKE